MISTRYQSPVFNQGDIDDLKSFYQFRRENNIVQFCSIHPHLLSILALGKNLISKYLPDSYVFLECVLEP